MAEPRRTKPYARYAVGFVAALLLLSLVFVLLPMRYQGRIVEVVTFGDWPLEWAARRHFDRKQVELQVIVDFIQSSPGIESLSITPSGLGSMTSDEGGAQEEVEAPNIIEALLSVETRRVNVHEGHPHVVLTGTEYRAGCDFMIIYARTGTEGDNYPSCDDLGARQRGPFGSCAIRLDDDWLLIYEWLTRDIEELEEALDQLPGSNT